MQIEFDPDNDEINKAKHGVSLALAGELEWDAALVWVDDRYEHDALRKIVNVQDCALVSNQIQYRP